MDRADLVAEVEALVAEYQAALNLDPYIKICVEIQEQPSSYTCEVSDRPAVWTLRVDPERHSDTVDAQLSAVSAVLTAIFRYIPKSSDIDEIISRLAHGIVGLTMPESDADVHIHDPDDVQD